MYDLIGVAPEATLGEARTAIGPGYGRTLHAVADSAEVLGMPEWMLPRHAPEAARTMSWLVAVTCVVMLLDLLVIMVVPAGARLATLRPQTPLDFALAVLVPALLVPCALAMRRLGPDYPGLLGLPTAVALIAAGTALGLQRHDATAGALCYGALPVLYASYHLRRHAALLTAGAAGLGAVAVTYSLLPPSEATRDTIEVCVTVFAIAVLVSRLRDSQEQAEEDLVVQAMQDPLTGLSTREVLDDLAEQHLCEPAGAALVLLDLDYFKDINDTYGRPAGDRVLQHVAGIISGLTRSDDVVSRIGGDEMALLLRGCPEHVAARRAQQLVTQVASTPLVVDDYIIPLSVSVGYAHDAGPTASLARLYRHADQCLYRAKRAGRGRVGNPS